MRSATRSSAGRRPRQLGTDPQQQPWRVGAHTSRSSRVVAPGRPAAASGPTDAPDVGPGPARMHPVGEQHSTVRPPSRSMTRDVPVKPVWPTVAGRAGHPCWPGRRCAPRGPAGTPGRCHRAAGRCTSRPRSPRPGRAPRRARRPAGPSRPGVPGPRPCRTCRHAPRHHPATRRSRRGRCRGACPVRHTTRPRSPRYGRGVRRGRNPVSGMPRGRQTRSATSSASGRPVTASASSPR